MKSSKITETTDNPHNHVVIIGGGMAGLTQAIALAKSGFDVSVIEKNDPTKFTSSKFDGRVSAITRNSKNILRNIGLWEDAEEHSLTSHAQPIFDIRITESNSPIHLDYEQELAGDEPMGYIVENRHIRKALLSEIKKYRQVNFLAPAILENVDYGNSFAEAKVKSQSKQISLKAKLIIAADGKFSPTRQNAGIKTTSWNYGQDGIVCTIKHKYDHEAEAREKFLPNGPFAVLPMQGGHHSSLVWVEKAGMSKHLLSLDKPDFEEQIQIRIGDYLGKIELVEPRFSYPLSLSFASEYIAPRLVLIGDAAHAIHPVAGQGFNLGLKDIALLTEILNETSKLGLDIGATEYLEKYQRIRRPDNLLMAAVTDNLNHLFSNNVTPLKIARNLGIGAVQQLSFLKQFFMNHAMGEVGYKAKVS